VAAENPDAILTFPIDIDVGLKKEDAKNIVEKLGFSPKVLDEVGIFVNVDSYCQIIKL
jgi:succinyl-CoA synthetase beta subunit